MFPRSSKSLLNSLRVGALFVLGIGSATQAQQQTAPPAPPAGTRILNQAETTYDYAGFSVRLQSNAVQIEVAPVEAVTLAPDNSRSVTPGGFVSLAHRLTNAGNVAADFSVRLAPQNGGGFALLDAKVIRDLNGNGNGNGLADAGEPEVSGAITLNAGESADLVVTGRVPATAGNGQTARLILNATSTAQKVTGQSTDTLTLSQDVAVEVTKSATPQNATRGGTVNWQIIANSRGKTNPAPIPVTVDGAPRSYIILRDELPANVTFGAFTGTPNVNATPLYYRVGDAFQTYTSAAQTPIDAIAWGLTKLDSGTTFVGAFSARQRQREWRLAQHRAFLLRWRRHARQRCAFQRSVGQRAPIAADARILH